MNQVAKIALAAALVAGFFTGAMAGVGPSPFINFQGVLRDSGDNPLDGNFDMTFRFFNATAGGSEILVDRHVTGAAGPVRVTAGLFSAVLGGGAVADGSGPGVYTDLAQVARDYATVYLEVQVGAETLSPRTRIHAAAYALNSSHLGGKAPTEYLDTSDTAQTKFGQLIIDRTADIASTGFIARADSYPGVFVNTDAGGTVNLAKTISPDGAVGVESSGTYRGATLVGTGDYGVQASGPTAGGYFEDSNSSGSARCGYGDLGISASGNSAGGYFSDADGDAWAWAAYGNYGVAAAGPLMGGSFQDTNSSGYAYCGHGDFGLRGYGDSTGGYFSDTDQSGYAYVGYGDRGIWAKGNFAGGTFSHPDNTTFWADVSTATYKIHGTGAVSFEQNHPYERDKVIVYAAPEGDEVAVYTRGSARLENGLARVALGPTFALVTNPDFGLTAHLTPRGAVVPLAVESVTTSELAVRGPAGADVAFDYIVYGLRVGFEDLAVVQPKTREALLPDAAAIEASYGGRPELRTYSAAARFRAMPGVVVRNDARGDELRRAIDGDRASAIGAGAGVAERDASPRSEIPAEPATGAPAAERAGLAKEGGCPRSRLLSLRARPRSRSRAGADAGAGRSRGAPAGERVRRGGRRPRDGHAASRCAPARDDRLGSARGGRRRRTGSGRPGAGRDLRHRAVSGRRRVRTGRRGGPAGGLSDPGPRHARHGSRRGDDPRQGARAARGGRPDDQGARDAALTKRFRVRVGGAGWFRLPPSIDHLESGASVARFSSSRFGRLPVWPPRYLLK